MNVEKLIQKCVKVEPEYAVRYKQPTNQPWWSHHGKLRDSLPFEGFALHSFQRWRNCFPLQHPYPFKCLQKVFSHLNLLSYSDTKLGLTTIITHMLVEGLSSHMTNQWSFTSNFISSGMWTDMKSVLILCIYKWIGLCFKVLVFEWVRRYKRVNQCIMW